MTSICVIGIYVDDIDKAVEFYCKKLGFKEVQRYDDGCIVRLENEGPPIILSKTENPSTAIFPSHSQVILGIETDDINNYSEVLRKMGVDFVHEGPQKFVAGQFMALKDPAGNFLELIQFHKEID